MRICVTGLRGIPDVSGGVETHCEHLYGRLRTACPPAQVIVYGRRPYVTGGRREIDTGLILAPLYAARNRYLEAITNTAIAIATARRDRADVIHVHAIGPALLSPFAKLLGLRVLLTHHGDDFARAKWNAVARTALRLGEWVGIRSADQIIAVSNTIAERLRAQYPAQADRIHYIPNGADHVTGIAAPAQTVLPRFGLDAADYIVSVGRLVPEKGFADLIAAHALLGPEAGKLVIVGGSSHSDHDKELRRLAGRNVVLTGTLPRAEVATLLSHARLFVLASYHEGLPIAALEAAALDAPVLLSDIAPNRDLGLPAQHYFPVGNVEALASRLADPEISYLRAPELKTRFSWDTIAAETGSLYRRITSGNSLP